MNRKKNNSLSIWAPLCNIVSLPHLCASLCICPLSPSTHRSCQTAQRWASGPSPPGFGVSARWIAWLRQAPSLRSLGRNITYTYTHTQSGGGCQEERTGACRLQFTLHRRCKQEARDGGADGRLKKIVSAPLERWRPQSVSGFYECYHKCQNKSTPWIKIGVKPCVKSQTAKHIMTAF